ncbi:MAG: HTH-type transcriptional regulator ImmR [Firmicutes bacterium ADurb.Bin354]|nr:MAG: HTH-type transcriptional regulator ImmR [Firmicutes bacterium ADurb.Bin354]
MNFAEKIVFLRKQNRFSQEKMAEDLNVSRQTISKWELGASQPTMELIVTLSKYFGVSTDYLLKDDSQLEDSDAMARVVLRFLDSVQNMEGLSKELVGIVSDGMIDDEEMSRLKDISKTLESIQRTFDELQAIINSGQKNT